MCLLAERAAIGLRLASRSVWMRDYNAPANTCDNRAIREGAENPVLPNRHTTDTHELVWVEDMLEGSSFTKTAATS